MNISNILYTESIKTGSEAETKSQVLKELAALAVKNPVLSGYSVNDIVQALEAREKVGSTGFENGIAIPHCSLENLDGFVLGLLIVPEGVDFQSMDGKKTKIFFLIIGPKQRRNQHIQILSSVSRLLSTPESVKRLLEAKDPISVKKIVAELLEFKEAKPAEEEIQKNLFQVFVQKEEYFNDILQIFTAAVPGSIAVVESSNAGYYLDKMPLFTAYWAESNRTFSRVILAVVDRNFTNEVIRRLNTIVENIDKEPGVLYTVQELFYTGGSIEF
ncbi:MAG: PTS sugar transporter subunit IIA [Spirochaetota bacterium]